jgi:hypothetical protein
MSSPFLGPSWKSVGGYERTPIGNYARFPYLTSETAFIDNISSGGGGGATGATGPQGPQGATGAQGPQGLGSAAKVCQIYGVLSLSNMVNNGFNGPVYYPSQNQFVPFISQNYGKVGTGAADFDFNVNTGQITYLPQSGIYQYYITFNYLGNTLINADLQPWLNIAGLEYATCGIALGVKNQNEQINLIYGKSAFSNWQSSLGPNNVSFNGSFSFGGQIGQYSNNIGFQFATNQAFSSLPYPQNNYGFNMTAYMVINFIELV